MTDAITSIVIPTFRRSETITTHRAVTNAIICCAEAEAEAYRHTCPDNEIVTHPDQIKGEVRKRQWIIDRFGTHLQLDDDLLYLSRRNNAPGQPAKVSPAMAYDIIQRTAQICRDMGGHLWSFGATANPIDFQPNKPFTLNGGQANGGTLGFIAPHRIFLPIDNDLEMVNDFWIFLINAYYHRFAFVDTRYSWAGAVTFTTEGGAQSIRNVDAERRGTLALRRTFGEVVIMKQTRKFKVTQFERTLAIPL